MKIFKEMWVKLSDVISNDNQTYDFNSYCICSPMWMQRLPHLQVQLLLWITIKKNHASNPSFF